MASVCVSSTSDMLALGYWWKYIWLLKVPTKVKIFLWRACNDWIPTMVNLVRRKIAVSPMCPIFNSSPETTAHAPWGCSNLKAL